MSPQPFNYRSLSAWLLLPLLLVLALAGAALVGTKKKDDGAAAVTSKTCTSSLSVFSSVAHRTAKRRRPR